VIEGCSESGEVNLSSKATGGDASRKAARPRAIKARALSAPKSENEPVDAELHGVIPAVDEQELRTAVGKLIVDAKAGGHNTGSDSMALNRRLGAVVAAGKSAAYANAASKAKRKLNPNTFAG